MSRNNPLLFWEGAPKLSGGCGYLAKVEARTPHTCNLRCCSRSDLRRLQCKHHVLRGLFRGQERYAKFILPGGMAP